MTSTLLAPTRGSQPSHSDSTRPVAAQKDAGVCSSSCLMLIPEGLGAGVYLRGWEQRKGQAGRGVFPLHISSAPRPALTGPSLLGACLWNKVRVEP